MSRWDVYESNEAIADRKAALKDVAQERGTDYALRWHAGLIAALHNLGEFPGPRAWKRVESEEQRLGGEVRMVVYGGPGRKPVRAVSYCILYAVYNNLLGEEGGGVRILRIVRAAGEEANQWSLGA